MGNFDNISFGGVIVDDLPVKLEPPAGPEFLDERKCRTSCNHVAHDYYVMLVFEPI